MRSRRHAAHHPARNEAASLVRAAAREPGRSLDLTVRRSVEARTGHDFGRVRVHDGPASEAAAHAYGANALTIGRDVYLGDTVTRMSRTERDRVLEHESIHALQQGERSVDRADRLPVSTPGDGAEREAHAISSFPLTHANVSSLGGPMIQRDLTTPQKVKEGQFNLALKTVSAPGGKSGLKGTIGFHPADKAPDADTIRIRQTGRAQGPDGKDFDWSGTTEKDKEKLKTKEDKAKGIEPGFMQDMLTATVKPRSKASDAAVSPYYRDYWPNTTGGSQEGSKKGTTIKDSIIWDFPGANGNFTFSFETVAVDAKAGHVYGSLTWGFKITDAAKGTVGSERVAASDAESATSGEALRVFNEFYRNPGSAKAPK